MNILLCWKVCGFSQKPSILGGLSLTYFLNVKTTEKNKIKMYRCPDPNLSLM